MINEDIYCHLLMQFGCSLICVSWEILRLPVTTRHTIIVWYSVKILNKSSMTAGFPLFKKNWLRRPSTAINSWWFMIIHVRGYIDRISTFDDRCWPVNPSTLGLYRYFTDFANCFGRTWKGMKTYSQKMERERKVTDEEVKTKRKCKWSSTMTSE